MCATSRRRVSRPRERAVDRGSWPHPRAALNAQETYLVEQERARRGRRSRRCVTVTRRSTKARERDYLSTSAAFLAHALHAEGEDDEAELPPREGEQAASPTTGSPRSSLVEPRRARDPPAAWRARCWKRRSPERRSLIGELTDLLGTRGDAISDLAEAGPRLAGRRDESLAALEDDRSSNEPKGNVTALARARTPAG